MKTIRLKPIYGYGWSEGDTSIDVPKPFNVRIHNYELTDDKKHYLKILGRIKSLWHRYNGKWVLLSVRALDRPHTYNARVYDDFPADSHKSVDESASATALASGFVELQR